MNLLKYAKERAQGIQNVMLGAIVLSTLTTPEMQAEARVGQGDYSGLMVQFKVEPSVSFKMPSINIPATDTPKTPNPREDVNTEWFLWAIRERETGQVWNGKPGSSGELGAYQFMKATWEMMSKRPHSDAKIPRIANTVALQHLAEIQRELKKRGMQANVYNCAVAWNAGVGAVTRGTAEKRHKDYGEAIFNLYNYYGPRLAKKDLELAR